MPTFVFSLFLAFAMQSKPAAEAARPTLPKPLAEMVDRARHVPAEFGADSLLRIAESDAVPSKDLKRELVEEAFRMAGAAQEPLKQRAAQEKIKDGRPNSLVRAFAQDLDALSLETRAVKDMLRIDKPAARELFQSIAPPRMPSLGCQDALGFDLSSWYETMAEIARTGFTPKELAAEEHVKFLAAYAGQVTAPAEVGPMAKALAGAQLSSDQLQMLLTTYSAALKTVSGDDRSFSFTVSKHETTLSDLEALAAAAKAKRVSTIALADALRTYLVRHLSAKRCWDTGGPTVSVEFGNKDPRPSQPDAVTFFNDRLRAIMYPPDATLAPLEGEEIRAAGVDFPEAKDPAPESDAWKRIADRYKALLYDDKGGAWSTEQRAETAWQAKLQEFLAALADWKPEGDRGDYFHRKSYLLGSLSNVAPAGPLREQVLESYLEFLQQNSDPQVRRIEWFLPVNTLLARAMFDSSLASLAEHLRNSPNAVISLYSQLDRMLPRSPGKLMELM